MKNSHIRKHIKISSKNTSIINTNNTNLSATQRKLLHSFYLSQKSNRTQQQNNSINLISTDQYIKQQKNENIFIKSCDNRVNHINYNKNKYFMKNYVESENKLFSHQQNNVKIVRYLTNNPKEQLKPRRLSDNLRKIQQRIKFYEKSQLSRFNKTQNNNQSQKTTFNNQNNFASTTNYGNLLFIKNTLINNQENEEQNENKNIKNNNNQTNKSSYQQNLQKKQWYIRAIEKHRGELKQMEKQNDKNQVIIKQNQQTQIMKGEKLGRNMEKSEYQVSRSLYPRIQSGFKKSSTAYEVKYF